MALEFEAKIGGSYVTYMEESANERARSRVHIFLSSSLALLAASHLYRVLGLFR